MRPSVTLALVLVFTSVLTAAAQTPSGKIIFYREYHFSDSSFIPPLFCDGVQLARILGGSYLEVAAPPGTHNCAAEADQRQAIPIGVTPGGTVYVLVRIKNGFKRQGLLSIVTEADYKGETKLTPMAAPIHLNGPQQLESAPVTPVGASHAGRFGDLVVTATTVAMKAGGGPDEAGVRVSVSVTNTGANTICSTLSTRLESTSAAEFDGDSKNAPNLSTLGPGESAAGSYDFVTKSDSEPVDLSVELAKSPANCGASARPLTPGISVPGMITLSLRDLPGSPVSGVRPGKPTSSGDSAGTVPPTAGPATMPRCIRCPAPGYSAEDRRSREQGTVVMKVTIDSNGLPRNIEIVNGSGYADLDQKAVEAVKNWRFTPGLDSSGNPVASITPIEVTFRLLQ